MNTIEPPHGDEQLATLLAAFDEALAAGLVASAPSSGPRSLDPTTQDRLRENQQVLEMLERVWPRQCSLSRTGNLNGDTLNEVIAAPGQLGRFQIVRELGRGGFGIVYLAIDPLLDRQVALKVPRPEALFTPELRQRFLREAQAAARLNHPNIVPVFDSGEAGALCYLVSGYCPGGTLATLLRRQAKPMPARAVARVVATLAEAVQHAHARGILHRDLKPGNILIDCDSDVLPDPSVLEPFLRLTDFGLAAFLECEVPATDDPSQRAAAQSTGLGTAEYMAPEQAEARPGACGPATDVYSLGVVLYEMLTGRPPFAGPKRADIVRRVLVEQPVPPRKLRPEVPRDLEAICLKCLAKQPARRYATAGMLTEDLLRFLEGRPTQARPASLGERMAKAARRRPATAALVAVLVLAAIGLAGTGIWHDLQMQAKNAELQVALDDADRERAQAQERGLKARQEAYAARMGRAADLYLAGQTGLLAELLDGLHPLPGENDLRGFEWRYLWRKAQADRFLRSHHGVVRAVAVSPCGKLCASGSEDRTVKLWDIATGRLRTTFKGHSLAVVSLAFSPDGCSLASGGYEDHRGGEWKLWDVATGKELDGQRSPSHTVNSVAFSPDGRALAIAEDCPTGGAGGVRLFDIAARQERLVFRGPITVLVVKFAPDGKSVAASFVRKSANEAPTIGVLLLDAATGKVARSLGGHQYPIFSMAFHPAGQTLATGSWDHTTQLWDVATGKVLATIPSDGDEIRCLAFSPDGQTLALTTAPDQGTSALAFYDAASLALQRKPIPLRYRVSSLAFLPTGKAVALGSFDHLVHLWSMSAERPCLHWPGHQAEAWAVAFAPDNQTLASASDDATVKLWHPATGQERQTLGGHESLVSCLSFAPGGQRLATGGYDQTVRLWDPATGKLLATLKGHTGVLRCVAFSPDGRTVASGGRDNRLMLWDATTGERRATLLGHQNEIRCVAFAADGKHLVTGSQDATLRIWDLASGTVVRVLQDTDEVWALAFSPDGNVLASGNKHGLVRFWDLRTGKEAATLSGHTAGVRSVAFTPDGKTLVSGSVDKTIRFWHRATGQEVFCLKEQPHEVNGVTFSPDGHRLAAALHDGSVRVWSVHDP